MTSYTFKIHDRYGLFVVAISANCYADAYNELTSRYGDNITIRNVICEACTDVALKEIECATS